MAHNYEREAGRYRGSGDALAQYPRKPGPDGDADRGHRTPASQLCGAKRAGKHSQAAGRGHRCGQSPRREIRQTTKETPYRVRQHSSGLGQQPNLGARGCSRFGHYAQNVPDLGAGNLAKWRMLDKKVRFSSHLLTLVACSDIINIMNKDCSCFNLVFVLISKPDHGVKY